MRVTGNVSEIETRADKGVSNRRDSIRFTADKMPEKAKEGSFLRPNEEQK